MTPSGTDIFCLSCQNIRSASLMTGVAELPKLQGVNSPQSIIPASETVSESESHWIIKHQVCVHCAHKVPNDIAQAFKEHIANVKRRSAKYAEEQARKRRQEAERGERQKQEDYWQHQIEHCPEILVRPAGTCSYDSAKRIVLSGEKVGYELIPDWVERNHAKHAEMLKQGRIADEEANRKAVRELNNPYKTGVEPVSHITR